LTIAGAGSVLGTLWELDEIHASSAFTEHFYKGLGTDIQMGKRIFVFQLAVAHQKAVCAMRKKDETNSLYHWACLFASICTNTAGHETNTELLGTFHSLWVPLAPT